MKTYAGIGSRETPPDILGAMTTAAARLQDLGYVLRSGAAGGADAAFEAGVTSHSKEIYLPWKGFNGSCSPFNYVTPAAIQMAGKYHPAWHRCSQGARKLHGRNMYQLLGFHLEQPSEFVLCWTPNGAVTGGTGQAIRVAEDLGIPVINMFHSDWVMDIRNIVYSD